MTRLQLNRRAVIWLFLALFTSRFATVGPWAPIVWCGVVFMLSAGIDMITRPALPADRRLVCSCVPVPDPLTHKPLHMYGCALHEDFGQHDG